MAEVSVLAFEFFAKHCLPTTEKEFAVEYEKFANLLMQRIEKEESVIYAYYDQLLRRD
jgi:hemerythrin-like domain-containing protein